VPYNKVPTLVEGYRWLAGTPLPPTTSARLFNETYLLRMHSRHSPKKSVTLQNVVASSNFPTFQPCDYFDIPFKYQRTYFLYARYSALFLRRCQTRNPCSPQHKLKTTSACFFKESLTTGHPRSLLPMAGTQSTFGSIMPDSSSGPNKRRKVKGFFKMRARQGKQASTTQSEELPTH
jgi:hypothetical protein